MGEAPEQRALASLGTWGFVGAGALGSSLARALSAAGAAVRAVTSLHHDHAARLAASLPHCGTYSTASDVVEVCDGVVLAVPDDAIIALDASLPWRRDQLAIHLSGARGADALAHAQTAGAQVAALHPLMIFPQPEPTGAQALARFAGCSWAVEAPDARAREAAHTIVGALGGHAISLRPEQRVPYHLAAVLASNYIVTLVGAATAIWQDLGLDGDTGREALLPLLRATVDRLAEQGPAAALAGPVARGDLGTVRAHLGWLRERAASQVPAGYDPADLHAAYLDLARLTVPLAVARGSLAPGAAQRLLDMLAQQDEPEHRGR